MAFGLAMAADIYHVGPGQTYTTLEDLRSPQVLVDGDTIILHADDASLTTQLYSGISPASLTLTIKSTDEQLKTISGGNIPSSNHASPYHGGILKFDNGDITLNLGNVAFADGSVKDTTGVAKSARGGAIYSFMGNPASLTINNSENVQFNNNSAIAFSNSPVGGGDITESGWGGAISAYKLTLSGSGDYQFNNNSARAGNSNEVNNNHSGKGGAIYANADLTMSSSGNYSFTNNNARAGDFNKGQSYYSGLGGAIFASAALDMSGPGSYSFTNNKALAGDSNSGNSSYSGQGGAIYSNSALKISGTGSYSFIGNQASDGSGNDRNSANNDVSGLGGAIFAHDKVNIGGGDITFLNNSAIANHANPTNGRGGAIFFEVNSVYPDNSFSLSAAPEKTVLFKGNTQRQGQANSIYFGCLNPTPESHRTIATTFTAAETGRIVMYDPIESQEDELKGVVGPYGSIAVQLKKAGSGVWSLGGVSNLRGGATADINDSLKSNPTTFTIAEGTFHQMDSQSQLVLNRTNPDHLNTFSVNAGAIFKPTVSGQDNKTSTVSAGTSIIGAGAKFEVGGAYTLTPDEAYSFKVIEADVASGDFTPLNTDLLSATLTRSGTDHFLNVTAKPLTLGSGFSQGVIDSGFFRAFTYNNFYNIATNLDNYYHSTRLKFRDFDVTY